MILVELNGGLGNQLFQYAAGLSLARHHNVELKVNIDSFNRPNEIIGTQRAFDLANLEKPPTIATKEEINAFLNQSAIRKYGEKILPFHKRSVYKEKDITYDTCFYKTGKNIYLKGNRQSEKYFLRHSEVIREALKFKGSVLEGVSDLGAECATTESVAIHIRRGDYLTDIATDVLGLIPISHYQSALKVIGQKQRLDKVYVFSDDIEWAKENLLLEYETTYVSGNHTSNSIEDFYLISQCKHQIIANSSFSWWAAWLNPNPDKIVIAPKKWFNNAPYDTRDLIPESWLKM